MRERGWSSRVQRKYFSQEYDCSDISSTSFSALSMKKSKSLSSFFFIYFFFCENVRRTIQQRYTTRRRGIFFPDRTHLLYIMYNARVRTHEVRTVGTCSSNDWRCALSIDRAHSPFFFFLSNNHTFVLRAAFVNKSIPNITSCGKNIELQKLENTWLTVVCV